MIKNDFFKRLNELYKPSKNDFSIIEVPKVRYMMIDGKGAPKDSLYQQAIKQIFMAIHPIRVETRKKLGSQFIEPPLECLWWSENSNDFKQVKKENWTWRLMIVLDHSLENSFLDECISKVKEKTGEQFLESLRYESYTEGKSVQIMHIGNPNEISYQASQMYEQYLPSKNLTPNGPYHEIYLNDMSRVKAENFKMIIRQPIK